MKARIFKAKDVNKIDLGTKVIYKYTQFSKQWDIGRMVVHGRNPEKKNSFLVEHECEFVMYVTKGNGKYYLDDEVIEVGIGDVAYVPKNTRFAAEGNFEYITIDIPAYYPEQSEEVEVA